MNEMKELQKRLDTLKEDNSKQKAIWQKITKYVSPSLSLMFGGDDTDGKQFAKDIYDSTAIDAAKTMTDGIIGNLVSKSTPWVGMGALDSSLQKDMDVQQFFQHVNTAMYSALSRSNFYNVLPTYTHMGITVATTTMFVMEDIATGRIIMQPRHPKEIFIGQNWFGDIDTIGREIITTAIGAANFFLKEKNALSKELIKAATDDPYKKWKILHMVFPAKDEWFKYPGTKGAVASVYWEEGQKEPVQVGGYDTFPFITWRYRVDGAEKYGRGPSHDALADIVALNVMKKTLLKAGQLAGDPPLNIPEEMKNKVRNKPGGANYYRDPGRVVRRWEVQTNYPFSVDQYNSTVKAVQSFYYHDFWKMLSNLTQRMTTVEIQERRGEQATLIATPISKYESEGLDRLLFRVFDIENKAGRMPEIPAKLKGTDVQWQYNGPLAQIQKRTAQNEGIKSTMTDLERILQFAPQAAQTFNWTNTARDLAINNGFPIEDLLSEKDVEQAQQAAAQQQQAAQGAAVANQKSQTIKNLSTPVDPNSIIGSAQK